MATVEDVASLALSAVDADVNAPVGIEQCACWVAERYRETVAQCRFRHRRRLGTILIPAAVTTGIATAVQNSATIALDATAQAAVTAAGGRNVIANGNWYIRLGVLPAASVWFLVVDYNAPTLTIETVYPAADVVATGFVLLPRFHTLAPDARWLGIFVYPRHHRRLQMRSFMDFDRLVPDRRWASAGPWYVAEASNTLTKADPVVVGGVKRVELYPYSETEEVVYYTYWNLPVLATNPVDLLDTELPQEIDPYVLREGVLIDLYRYRASQAANTGNVEAAGYWRNESRAQMTSWQKQLQDAARADRGMDDVSFILHTTGLGGPGWGGDIRDGYSQWVNYGWPTSSGGSA